MNETIVSRLRAGEDKAVLAGASRPCCSQAAPNVDV